VKRIKIEKKKKRNKTKPGNGRAEHKMTVKKFCRPTWKGLGKLIMFELKQNPTGPKSIFINDLRPTVLSSKKFFFKRQLLSSTPNTTVI